MYEKMDCAMSMDSELRPELLLERRLLFVQQIPAL